MKIPAAVSALCPLCVPSYCAVLSGKYPKTVTLWAFATFGAAFAFRRKQGKIDEANNMIFRIILWRGMILGVLWWILTEGRSDQWGVGVATVALAVAASLLFPPPDTIRFSLPGLFLFLAYFFRQSVVGGVRVALLALGPRANIRPRVEAISSRMPEGVGRVILVNTLNLLPGTLVVNLAANRLYLHVLDMRGAMEGDVRDVETRIAGMLGLTLDGE